ncbi:MAG: DUF6516 family protein [Pseudomonadales bacterium]|jgi:hypothetical protein|nr:DUF6516 family protein [Pseudomonadales bacterium]
MAKATLILNTKTIIGKWIVQRRIWALPQASVERPHRLKYSLFCGNDETCLVRYDNEAGKGDHRHYGAREEPYPFTTLETLLRDFRADVSRLTKEE